MVADPDISTVTNITKDSRAHEALPAWSPTGDKIVFVSNRDGNSEIYTMNPDGSDVHRLTRHPASDFTPTWLPDGRVGFVSNHGGRFYDIYTMDADGGNLVRLTKESSEEVAPVWSPDGTQTAFVSNRDGNTEVYVMNADGSDVRNLTNNPAEDFEPEWSPDGTRILFTSDRRNGQTDIYAMNADGTNVIPIAQHPAADSEGTWSPDGTQVMFVSARKGILGLYRMTVGESRALRLGQSPGSGDFGPRWYHPRPSGEQESGETLDVPTADEDDLQSETRFFVRNDLGLGFDYPITWSVHQDYQQDSILIVDDYDAFTSSEESALSDGIGVLLFPMEYSEPDDYIARLPSQFPHLMGPVESTIVWKADGHSYAAAEYFEESKGGGFPVHFFIAAISSQERSVTALTAVRSERAEEVRPVFNMIVRSIRLIRLIDSRATGSIW